MDTVVTDSGGEKRKSGPEEIYQEINTTIFSKTMKNIKLQI